MERPFVTGRRDRLSARMSDASQPPQIVLSGGTRLARALEKNVPAVIGQQRGVLLRIPHPTVGAVHCSLLWDGHCVLLEDGPGPSGTLVNGEPLGGSRLLRHGDELTVGRFSVIFEWPDQGPETSADPTITEPATLDAARRHPSYGHGSHGGPLVVRFVGREVSEVPVVDGLTFGFGDQAHVQLDDPGLSAIQLRIERHAEGFAAVDSGRTGSLVNGRYFDHHVLVIGDLLQLGERHYFTYDGYALRRVRNGLGAGLQAWGITVPRGPQRPAILENVSFDARPGQFVGILGPSGAGKTTLLRVLTGLRRPSAGTVRVDGRDRHEGDDTAQIFGYVPQQEIVHLELTGRQALRYAALLRLPRRTPRAEIERLIGALAERLGLAEHLETQAGRLSGGQLKRLSVAVELLNRPRLLFLDEPTSGLDPEAETDLMQHLQQLSYTGCTVVCTTHVLENAYLLSSLEIVAAGRDASGVALSGRTVFRGRAKQARQFFEVPSLAKLYARLHERTPLEWQARYLEKNGHDLTRIAGATGEPQIPIEAVPPSRPLPRRPSFPLLIRRQWHLLRADTKSLSLLAGQPLLIAVLLALFATGPDAAEVSQKKLFLAIIATLWLGCGNAAPALVKERSVFLREKFVGLSPASYLLAKLFFFGPLAAMQGLIIWAILCWMGEGVAGARFWQVLGFGAAAMAATAIGLALSAAARTTLQAVLMVPVVIIPQILAAGYVFPIKDWDKHAIPRIAARFCPSFAAERIIDTSLMWNVDLNDPDKDYPPTALQNLNTTLRPLTVWLDPSKPRTFPVNDAAAYRPPPAGEEPFGFREAAWDQDKKVEPKYSVRTMRDDRPRVFADARPALSGLAGLAVWTTAATLAAWVSLRRAREE